MSSRYNVNELTASELTIRVQDAPNWVKNAPAQAQRRYLANTYPRDYFIGKAVKGAIGGHKKHRGVWSTSQCDTFIKKAVKAHKDGLKIDYKRICQEVIEAKTA